MVITLTQEAIYAIVKRSLSIIGKRSVDDEGNPLFQDITLGTNETSLVNDYIGNAITDLAVEMSDFVTASTDTTITITLPGNHKAALESFIQKACTQYCVSYTLFSWFTITAPKLSEKYLADANRQRASVVNFVYNKQEPAAGASSYSDVNGTVTNT